MTDCIYLADSVRFLFSRAYRRIETCLQISDAKGGRAVVESRNRFASSTPLDLLSCKVNKRLRLTL